MNMLRVSFFIVAFIIIGCSEAISVLTLSEYDVIHVVDYHNSCSTKDVERWANVFVNCFVNRRSIFKTSRDFFNIVARLLDRSKRCIKYSTLECRPNYDGFVNIMGKVIQMIKEYCNMHVERLTNAGIIAYAQRADKIIDLNCVENRLTMDTYASCFSSAISTYEQLGENETYDLIYQKDVEMAILCTNAAIRQCSKSVKVDLNKVVRYILGVKQPEKEDIENDRMSFEVLRSEGLPKPPAELRKTGKKNIDDNSEIQKISDSTSSSDSTEFPETENEKHESNIPNTDLPEFSNFPKGKNYDDTQFRNRMKSLKFTETLPFSEQTIIRDLMKSEKENMKSDPKISEGPDFIEITLPSERSKVTNLQKSEESSKSSTFSNTRKGDNDPQFTEALQPLKTTEFPKHEGLNSTGFDSSKDFANRETGKDIMIGLLDWKGKSTMYTEPSTTMERFVGIMRIKPGKKSDDLQFAMSPEILENTGASKSKDLMNSSDLDVSNNPVEAKVEENTMAELTKTSFEENFTASTKLPKFIDLPKSSEFSKSVDLISTKSTKSPIWTKNPTITSTEPPKPTEFPKTTSSTKTPKPTEFTKTTAFTKPPKPLELPKTTTSTKPPKSSVRLRTSTSTKPPKPTEGLRTTPKSTRLPRTTTTIRSTVSSSVFRSRSRDDSRSRSRDDSQSRLRDDDSYRPTEAPARPWYDFIVRPFVSLWRTIKSWFGW